MGNEFNYEQLLRPLRFRPTTVHRENIIDEYYSDRSRIIFSSSFRRLQQKAQVFSLEPNSSVRTRLTHSIEVSDLGRSLASKISSKLIKSGIIEPEMAPTIVAVVENACLLHDIGNPPFGHFGETAIKKWVTNNLKSCADEAGVGYAALEKYISDFLEFDGNPQGIRTITRLHCELDNYGLNLSYPTILTGIKYVRFPGEEKDKGIKKKAGYFFSEKELIDKLYKDTGINRYTRYPLAYIMEAADDIAYSLSDISDGIEKHIITKEGFIQDFETLWDEKNKGISIPVDIPQKDNYKNFSQISTKWSNYIIDEAVNNYITYHKDFYAGKAKSLIDDESMGGKILDVITTVSRNKLYRSAEAENIELSGYSTIKGLLDCYGELLKLPYNKFMLFVEDGASPQGNNVDYEWRLFNRLSKRCVETYKYQLKKVNESSLEISGNDYEWWLRVHLIIDYISGMTDDYALSTYQMLKGININV